MTSKGLALVLAAALAVSACDGAVRPESRAIQPDPTVAEQPTTSSGIASSAATEVSPSSTTVIDPDPASAEAAPSTTSTTLELDSPTSTNANPTESIDLAEVQDALDALGALFEDLDTHIGSVDLEEGETP